MMVIIFNVSMLLHPYQTKSIVFWYGGDNEVFLQPEGGSQRRIKIKSFIS